ncbi:MAG: GNAT family N-acetyltransferase [Candidatus Thiodiazotropha sp. (ex Epidulcina cf. delphinae)]|nr:GNAT family N-acetyltransferase [Candidatus Thiodiazotropha sp. (ex Epidulcina cf. delphinae)]
MEITAIEDPNELDSKPIEDGVMEYGLMQVNETAPKKWAFYAKNCGELIGGAIGRVHFSQFYLDNIWVKEDARSRGIGESVHQKVVACAERYGCRRIQLNTLNEKAVKFYRRLGYETLAMIEDYVDGFNLYYMAREI